MRGSRRFFLAWGLASDQSMEKLKADLPVKDGFVAGPGVVCGAEIGTAEGVGSSTSLIVSKNDWFQYQTSELRGD